jgi:hypothetical protein
MKLKDFKNWCEKNNPSEDSELSIINDEGMCWGSNITLEDPEIIISKNLTVPLLRFQQGLKDEFDAKTKTKPRIQTITDLTK